jgi:hypothetical protein
MRLDEFITKLEGLGDSWDCEVCVEVNGVVHEIQAVQDDSQGITIIVDTDAEERAMR